MSAAVSAAGRRDVGAAPATLADPRVWRGGPRPTATAFSDVLFARRKTPAPGVVVPKDATSPSAAPSSLHPGRTDSPRMSPCRSQAAPEEDESDRARNRRAASLRVADFQPQLPIAGPAPAVMMTAGSRPEACATSARTAASLEDLVPALVRRVAWSGDGRRGTARLEIASGELAGGVLLVHADDGRVTVHLTIPPGASANEWQARIRARLAARNIATEAVEVT